MFNFFKKKKVKPPFPPMPKPPSAPATNLAQKSSENVTHAAQGHPSEFPTFPTLDLEKLPEIEPPKHPTEEKPVLKEASLPNIQIPTMEPALPKSSQNEQIAPSSKPSPSFKPEMPEPPVEIPPDIPQLELPAELTPVEKENAAKHYASTPLFISVDNYKKIVSDLQKSSASLGEYMSLHQRMHSIKLAKNKAFSEWKSQLEDIQRKLLFIDKTLFEGG